MHWQRKFIRTRATARETMMTMMTIAMAMTMTTVLMLILMLKSTLKTIGGDKDVTVVVVELGNILI